MDMSQSALGQVLAKAKMQIQTAEKKQIDTMTCRTTEVLKLLNALPTEAIESRAQSHHQWHSRESGYIPMEGDLVTFVSGNNTQATHVGIVKSIDQNQVDILSVKGSEKGDKTTAQLQDNLFNIQDTKIRGYISSPQNGAGTDSVQLSPLAKRLPLLSLGSFIHMAELHKRIMTTASSLLGLTQADFHPADSNSGKH